MAKEILLTQDKVAIVDDEDYAWLNQWKWCTLTGEKTFYASRGQWDSVNKGITAISMHRLIMGFPDLTVDHKDGDGLNNQRANLRIATKREQAINRSLRADNASGYKGVYWLKTGKNTGKWRAQIKVDGKRKSLGLYHDVQEAARAYEEAAEKYYGEFRRING